MEKKHSVKRADFQNGVFAVEYPKVFDLVKIPICDILQSGKTYFVTDSNGKPLFIPYKAVQTMAEKNQTAVDLSDLRPDWKRKVFSERGRRTVMFLSYETLLNFGFGYLWDI